jgi:hypothetical protein
VSSKSAETLRRAGAGLLLCAAAALALAAAPAQEILGTWLGTSTCVKNPDFPACRDEVVVYEFREAASGGGAVTLAAYKIVDGEKGLMGEMDFTYDAKQRAWTSELKTARVHALWTFFVKGEAITGTLVDLPSTHLVRNVAVKRERAPAK